MGTETQLRTAAAAALSLCLACGSPPAAEDELARVTNLGKARLENREARPAVEAFSRATELAPRSAPAWRNLARARLLARDAEAAEMALIEAAAVAESAATSYLRGLAAARRSDYEAALPHFEQAVRLDPRVAALRYQLATTYQATGSHDPAREQLRETLRFDPLHTTAHYKLLGYAQRAGDREEVALREREVLRLRSLFGEQSRTAEALEKCSYTQAEPLPARLETTTPALEVTFSDVTGEVFSGGVRAVLEAAAAVTVIEVAEDGRPTLFVAGADGRLSLISLEPGSGSGFAHRVLEDAGGTHALPAGSGSGFALDNAGGTPAFPVAADRSALFALAGNYHDEVPAGEVYDPAVHARADVLLLHPGGARLFAGTVEGGFADATDRSGLGAVVGSRARWVDYEADGDVDLLVATRRGPQLWQNNGDGTFEEVTAAAGVAGEEEIAAGGRPVADVAVADLDGNVVLDLVLARGEAPTRVLENRRTGQFRPLPEPPGPWPPARRVLLDDLDHDGSPDAVLVAAGEVTIVASGSPWRHRLDLDGLEPAAAALLDFDNDGQLDLLVAGRASDSERRGGLRLWRNEAGIDGEPAAWIDRTARAGLDADLAPVREIEAVDLDVDGDTDLLLLTERGLRFWRNEGGHENRQLKLRLAGTKTNPGGLGTRVEVRRGRFWASRTVSELPIEIGLGGESGPLDTVQVTWTNGIVDNQLDVAAGAAPLAIVEKNVATGSCPFLYAWDGRDFRFVTDVLGNSPVGLSLRRGVPLDADPDEIVRIGSAADFPAAGGAYRLQMTEEMREILYLDQVRLLAVDHAPETEVHPTDKLMPAPFPASELWALGQVAVPRRVASDDGVERLAALQTIDGVYAPPGLALPPPLRGMTRPLSLTFDFGPLDAYRSPILALTGWLQYGDASTNIAVSQGAAEALPPRLEVEVAGRFEPIDVVVGMPAGKTKTILVDLEGLLPPGARRLRLSTNFEIRWDRVALAQKLPAASIVEHAAEPASARLAWRGFSEIHARAPGHPTAPRFAAVSGRPPWRMALQGWATRYGDVLELVNERDQRLAIVGAGDALELAFDAAAFPPPAPGRVRTFFCYSVGWDKDGDANVIDGDAIEPLPVAAAGDWRLRYNTRWVPRDRFR